MRGGAHVAVNGRKGSSAHLCCQLRTSLWGSRESQFNKKNEKKLREVLFQLYSHLGRADSAIDDSTVAVSVHGPAGEYYPYVTCTFNLDLIK